MTDEPARREPGTGHAMTFCGLSDARDGAGRPGLPARPWPHNGTAGERLVHLRDASG
jgi:hypothetical protein